MTVGKESTLEVNRHALKGMMSSQVEGIGKLCGSVCLICASVRSNAPWLKPAVKAEYC